MVCRWHVRTTINTNATLAGATQNETGNRSHRPDRRAGVRGGLVNTPPLRGRHNGSDVHWMHCGASDAFTRLTKLGETNGT